MRKLFTLLILMCCAISMSATVYIGGKELASGKSFSSSSGVGISAGKISLSGSTLTLDNVTMTSNSNCISISNTTTGLTIALKGTNSLTTNDMPAMNLNASVTIKSSSTDGSGILNAKAATTKNYEAIRVQADVTLTIQDCTVKANGVSGGIGGYISSGASTAKLIVNWATVESTGNGNWASLRAFESITLDGSEITSPSGAAFNESQKCVCTSASSTTPVYSTVKIAPIKYPISVKGTQVTGRNKNDIFGDGTVKLSDKYGYYDLYFTNATISLSSGNVVYVSNDCERKVFLSFAGKNTLSSSSDVINIRSKNQVVFDKEGTADAVVNITCTGTANNDAIYIGNEAESFEIRKNLTINATSKGAYGIRSLNSKSFSIRNTTVNATGGSYSGGCGAILSNVKPTLTDVFVETPTWGEYNSSKKGYTYYGDRNSSTASLVSTVNIVPGEDYNYQICGIGVNSTNASNMLTTLTNKKYLTAGSVTAAKDYIVFNSATVSCSNANIVKSRNTTQEIDLKGTNTINSNSTGSVAFRNEEGGFYFRYWSDEDNDNMTLNSAYSCFYAMGDIKVLNTTIDATANNNVCAYTSGTLIADNSTVVLVSKDSSGKALTGAKNVDYTASYAYNGSYNTTSKSWVNYNNEISNVARILRGYGIRVGQTDITKNNLSIGEISYDVSANKLTIGNFTNTDDGSNTSIYSPLEIHKKGLTIDVTGKCTLTSKGRSCISIACADDVTITGKGTIDLSGSQNPALYAYKTNVNIEETTLNAKGVDGGIEVNGGKLTINHSTVSAYGDDYCIHATGGSTLKDCEVTTPEGGSAGIYFSDKNGSALKGTTCKVTPADYNIWIAGTQVTSKNASKITGTGISGTVSYNRASKTLTLNNATINGGSKAAIEATEDITVKLIGSNTISRSTGAPFATSQNATITSSSNGTLTSTTSGSQYHFLIGNDATTTIENCTVNINGGKSGIEDYTGHGDLPILVINNANVNIDAGTYAVYRLKSLTLSNCYYYYPSNAVFEAAEGYITTSNRVCSDLQIKAGQPTKYGFTVAGTEVTNANADDVLCDGGKVKYDNSTKTLTLNNAGFDCESGSGINVQNFGSTFKINLIGSNKIYSAKYNGIYAANTSVEISSSSNASLYVASDDGTSNGYSPIFMYGNGNLTVSNCKITTNNYNYGIRAKGSASSTITLDGATIENEGEESYAIANFKNVNLKNSTIKSAATAIGNKDIVLNMNLDGTNEINANGMGIRIDGSTSNTSTISSKTGGSLVITSGADIYTQNNLIIKDCKLTCKGYSGISGNGNAQDLTIDNATVKINSKGTGSYDNAIFCFANLELKNGIQIISPDGAAFSSSLHGVAKDGALCKSVEIGVKGYSIKVDGKSITSQNCNDVLGDGKVKFNPETNTLTLNNATITSSNQALLIGAGTYTLDLIGNNTITGTNLGLGVALGVLNVTSSTGTGKLTCSAAASGNSTGAIATAIGAITIENCTVEAKNTVGIAINGLEAGALTIKNANVTANGKEACIAGFTELNLEGCYIDEPGGAEIRTVSEYKSVYLGSDYAKDQNVVIKAGDNPHIVPPTVADNNISLNSITHESMSLSWNAANDNDTPASDIVYHFIYTNETTGESKTQDVTGQTTTVIAGLAEQTEYEVEMRAYDKDGNNCSYKTMYVTTTAAPDVAKPTLPADATITAKEITKTSITITWNAASDDKTPAADLNYEVLIQKDGAWTTVANLTGVTEYTIEGLEDMTEYKIAVYVSDDSGNEAAYETLTASTAVGIDAILAENPDVKMYNTAGVLVGKNYRGVVIINGKKYMKTK